MLDADLCDIQHYMAHMYWSWQAAPERHAGVVETAGVNFEASEHDISS